ncbi:MULTISPECIES: hypothetical protein [Rhizobium]|uniref:Uncharacterized protein n=2 Tax=Rhizobium TaxID=379 RepID=A0A1S9GU92_9HYPH|nr:MULTISPECIES: hypothetical protein [Rhizobium]MBB3166564.1 hypothetical protein [Rhizobium laguerreae]MBY5325436.1 hypothetical protein [Rhizobium leguminosarum]MBY5385398.1 hypothetical protein [Rhizobium leguminosarum]NEH46519.1 hypothetical protein [Rhizobium leguminosarum]NEH71079.1 hypothetical protein [Rhizobium leguminosarum]
MPQSVDAGLKEADFLVSALENEGVEYIFGVSAEESFDAVESLRNSKIKLSGRRPSWLAPYGRLTCQRGVGIAASIYAANTLSDDQASMRSVMRSTYFDGLDFEPVLLSSVSFEKKVHPLQ